MGRATTVTAANTALVLIFMMRTVMITVLPRRIASPTAKLSRAVHEQQYVREEHAEGVIRRPER
jgi:hypothetical protein